MVQVSKQGSATSTITELGKILGPITRGRLLRAGVRVPYYIKGDVSKLITFYSIQIEKISDLKIKINFCNIIKFLLPARIFIHSYANCHRRKCEN